MPRSLPPAHQPTSTPPPPSEQPRGPAAVGKSPQAPGSAHPHAGARLPLPHEGDESTGAVASQPQPIIEQAKRDVDAGLVDTDKRSATGLADAPAGAAAAPAAQTAATKAPSART